MEGGLIMSFQVEALEPDYNLKHIWQGFELLKAQNIALDLSHNGWRDVKIVDQKTLDEYKNEED